MSTPFQARDLARFEAAITEFDAQNSADPNRVNTEAGLQPRELVYAQWLTAWVLRLDPNASEELRLAARSQHLCRWMIPRESYPMTRAGYLRWRQDLKGFHADKAGAVLRRFGYPEEMVARVQSLNLKQEFPRDPDTRVLEDALCLVFLEHQFQELAAKLPREKMLSALKKTWNKMTSSARVYAQALPFTPLQRELLDQALKSPGPAGEAE